jgi:hypothetical protein
MLTSGMGDLFDSHSFILNASFAAAMAAPAATEKTDQISQASDYPRGSYFGISRTFYIRYDETN